MPHNRRGSTPAPQKLRILIFEPGPLKRAGQIREHHARGTRDAQAVALHVDPLAEQARHLVAEVLP